MCSIIQLSLLVISLIGFCQLTPALKCYRCNWIEDGATHLWITNSTKGCERDLGPEFLVEAPVLNYPRKYAQMLAAGKPLTSFPLKVKKPVRKIREEPVATFDFKPSASEEEDFHESNVEDEMDSGFDILLPVSPTSSSSSPRTLASSMRPFLTSESSSKEFDYEDEAIRSSSNPFRSTSSSPRPFSDPSKFPPEPQNSDDMTFQSRSFGSSSSEEETRTVIGKEEIQELKSVLNILSSYQPIYPTCVTLTGIVEKKRFIIRDYHYTEVEGSVEGQCVATYPPEVEAVFKELLSKEYRDRLDKEQNDIFYPRRAYCNHDSCNDGTYYNDDPCGDGSDLGPRLPLQPPDRK